jgi:hypothetical protein
LASTRFLFSSIGGSSYNDAAAASLTAQPGGAVTFGQARPTSGWQLNIVAKTKQKGD